MGKREKVRARQLKKARGQKQKGRPNDSSRKQPKAGSGGAPRGGGGRGGAQHQPRRSGVEGMRVQTGQSATPSASHPRKRVGGQAQAPFQYSRSQSILILGDGDFTFSRAMIRQLKTSGADEDKSGAKLRLTCTSVDSRKKVHQKYKSSAPQCIEEIEAAGVKVMHSVDATKLNRSFNASKQRFDRIIFNFPHSGMQRVHINRALLRDFFASAKDFLGAGGEIHVSLKITPPYSNWNIVEEAASSGLKLKTKLPFYLAHFSGYHHRTTDPLAQKFEPEFCRTFVFVKNPKSLLKAADETAASPSASLSEADSSDEADNVSSQRARDSDAEASDSPSDVQSDSS